MKNLKLNENYLIKTKKIKRRKREKVLKWEPNNAKMHFLF